MEHTDQEEQEELSDLRGEIERFRKEKERVRTIVGSIGGMPTFNTKAFNVFFVALIVATLTISLITEEPRTRLAMIELAVAALSLKLIFLINRQARVNHFQLWILSSLEWRLNEITKEIETNAENTKAE